MKLIVELQESELEEFYPEAGEQEICDEIREAIRELGFEDVKVRGTGT